MKKYKYVFEVFEAVRKARAKKDKVAILKANDCWPVKDVIRGTMDESIVWNLPTGAPPYTAAEAHNHPASLMRENKKFGHFIKGGPGDKLPPFKRENIFMGIIEGVHPEDAKLVIDMINKKTPSGFTRPVVEEAFPGLLQK